jgi:GWxTD domain-containing protein
MKKKIKIIAALLAYSFAGYSFGQVENSTKFSQPRFNYYQDFLNFSSEESNQTRLDIFVQVPYAEVQFVKSSSGFEANYTVTVTIFDGKKERLIVEKLWTEKLFAQEFDQTISKSNFNLSMRSFTLAPGNYHVRTAIEDLDSRKTYSSENQFLVKDFSGEASLSDIMLIAKRNVIDGTSKILPNVARNIISHRDGIPMFFEIYSKQSGPVYLEYKITDKDQKVMFQKAEIRTIDSGKTQVFYTIDSLSLSLGNFTINVSLRDDNNNLLSLSSKTFTSRWVGIPQTIVDLDKAIAQIVYIASDKEIRHIEAAQDNEEKIKRYLDFWKSKDPTPNTEENEIFNEYYRRVAYANDNFSHYQEGWRTDRGMVFIILGTPSNVDRHPFDYDSKPYEIWEYYELNRSFVFVDETGFGDYRLVTPLYGDYYRFRN